MELTRGELFVVLFVLVAIVSFPVWPRVGERLGGLFGGRGDSDPLEGDEGADK